MRILLIEDDEGLGAEIKGVLEQQQHTVAWAVCARTTKCGLSLMLPPRKQKKLSAVAFADFDLALVDQALPLGDSMQGDELVPALKSNGICCIGISNDYQCNKDLIEAGATFFEMKTFVAERLEKEPQFLERALKKAGSERLQPRQKKKEPL